MIMQKDYAFEMATSGIRFGPGITAEIGMDLVDAGLHKALVITDPHLVGLPPVQNVLTSLDENKIACRLYQGVCIEPTDRSIADAIRFAQGGEFDCIVAVGGGSSIDTAKAVNLFTTYPADFLEYVNAPIGRGKPVPGPLKPLFAIPTTTGTGSETTGITIFNLSSLHAKTGIAHRQLKPFLGLIDPENTRTMPAAVVASTGLDVLSHAVESYTAIHYRERPRPERPLLRPAYQGSNPLSDIWSLAALRMVNAYLIRAFRDENDLEARGMMHLAAGMAGVGFGNAGVHLPHGMSYPVSSNVRAFVPEGYPSDHPIIPHGMSVILNAPSVFRLTSKSNPARHLRAAEALGADVSGVAEDEVGEVLARRIIDFMKDLNMPNGLAAVGYSDHDIPKLVQGTLPQHRITKLSSYPVNEEVLSALFRDAMAYW